MRIEASGQGFSWRNCFIVLADSMDQSSTIKTLMCNRELQWMACLASNLAVEAGCFTGRFKLADRCFNALFCDDAPTFPQSSRIRISANRHWTDVCQPFEIDHGHSREFRLMSPRQFDGLSNWRIRRRSVAETHKNSLNHILTTPPDTRSSESTFKSGDTHIRRRILSNKLPLFHAGQGT